MNERSVSTVCDEGERQGSGRRNAVAAGGGCSAVQVA